MSRLRNARTRCVGTWQRLAAELFVPVRCRAAHDRFEAACEQRTIVRGLHVSRLGIDAHSAERTPALIADGVDDVMLVIPPATGVCELAQHGRGGFLPPGSVTLCELDAPFRFELQDRADDLVLVQVSRALLGVSRRTVRRVSALPIGPSTPAQPALRAVLETLGCDPAAGPVGAPADDGVAESLADVTVRLVATVIRAFLTGVDGAPPREAQLEELRASMQRQLGDATLTVDRLAAQHFLSVRQVHALFAEQGDSPAAYLRRIRLARAAGMLAVRASAGVTVRSVAHENGYADAAAFSRAFSRAYGARPGSWAASAG
ncbi:helix-turn-helix domain-containing protein [Leucobacter zeae]|nr:helix-turn-helix domain-containing protein [Leucobacter zeae]